MNSDDARKSAGLHFERIGDPNRGNIQYQLHMLIGKVEWQAAKIRAYRRAIKQLQRAHLALQGSDRASRMIADSSRRELQDARNEIARLKYQARIAIDKELAKEVSS